ncbi:urea amidolyase family protein [Microbacterium betulae]|uniref:Urea amidolyase family protein n=1 Tax=Microbacterium betulae TaxID=2981139 RepID=A0AA97FEP2_9MICO|nr:urea amidolyase family protein [Microbacterium sp. AB]WOF21758.1 urea amidolyase family protein [Microbacterium sp. AB]
MRRVLTASDRALLVEEKDLDATMRLHAALAAAGLAGVTELVPAARTVLVRFDPLRTTASALRRALEAIPLAERDPAAASDVVIGVRYGGEDLADVAADLGVTAEELVARHAAATWRVAFTGFAPGFGYLVGDDPLFDVPRRASPRTSVPPGSVALAGPYSGVYPRASPGGWRLIGRTDAVLWDLERDPPALLVPGAVVRFADVARPAGSQGDRLRRGAGLPATPSRASQSVRPPAAREPLDMPGDRGTRYAVEVVSPGLRLLVQDLGRPGAAHLGVSASGAADRAALRAANRAVGNGPGAPAFELLGGGAVLRFRGGGVAAIRGAAADATVRHRDGAETPVANGGPIAVDDGDELTIGYASRGVRAVVAIRGGLALTPALGSLATDTLGDIGSREIGGRALRPGDVVPLHGPSSVSGAVVPFEPPALPLPAPGGLVTLRITLGPRDDWFADEAVRLLLVQEWEVTPRSDRVGIRLRGAAPLERAVGGELPSEGTVTGSLQVPPRGQPVLFLPDRPVTGGYPVIGAVVDADLDLAGQLAPGMRVRFRTDGDAGPDVGAPS